MPFTLGLTGSIGCGKSTASSFLADYGFTVINCDTIVHKLLAQDTEIHESFRKQFGNTIFNNIGQIDRMALKNILFNLKASQASIHQNINFLEKIIHPKVNTLWQKAIESKNIRCVIEIPLLFEKNFESFFDISICVSASPEVQLQRLEKKGMSPLHMRTILSRQLPLSTKCTRADIVFSNNGSLDFLKKQIDFFIQQYFPS